MHKKWGVGKIIKIAMGVIVFGISVISFGGIFNVADAAAAGCPELEVIFVRGSGGTRWVDDNYNAFKDALEEKLKLTSIDYEFLDLDYPAVGIGLLSYDQVRVTLGAAVGSGDAYEFGKSVDAGVSELVRVVNTTCPDTKFVAGGYSQGAMVVSKALAQLNSEKVIYMATFGDPKIYLPEGKGAYPDACKGLNLSDYRIYVPDCRAYEGKLGSYRPYEPAGFSGKLGTWCNKHDFFCSPYLNITSHVSYISDDLYGEASKTIFDKIVKAFNVANPYTALQNVAIVVDEYNLKSANFIKLKDRAKKLANDVLQMGGKVSFFKYFEQRREDPTKMFCNLSWCDANVIEKASFAGSWLPTARKDEDTLLVAVESAMIQTQWEKGGTKSLVLFTDTSEPGINENILNRVVQLSKSIDPVSVYVVTNEATGYEKVTTATGGRVVMLDEDLASELMTRYDSLSRVEEMSGAEVLAEISAVPEILAARFEQVGEDAVLVEWETEGVMTAVWLNEALVGFTDAKRLVLTGIDGTLQNIVTLTPMSETVSGERVEIEINLDSDFNEVVPKAPNTGRG